jgi:hypothetical protein
MINLSAKHKVDNSQVNINVNNRVITSDNATQPANSESLFGRSPEVAGRSPEVAGRSPEVVVYNDSELVKCDNETITKLENKIHALEDLVSILQSNPLKYNGYIIADDETLECFIKDLTGADSVSINAEDIDCNCTTSNKYRHITGIYIVKDNITKTLKYDYPDVYKYLQDLKISVRLCF